MIKFERLHHRPVAPSPAASRPSQSHFSSTHPSFYFSQGNSPCLPPFTSLKPAFLHCVVHPFLALAHLDSLPPYDLVLWTDGSAPFGNGGSGVLADCSLCVTEATLSFSAGLVCSSVSAEACAILHALAGLGSTNKFAIALLLLSDSRSVLTNLSSPPSFLLPQSLWQIWQELFFLSSCSIRLQWVPRHTSLPGNDAADELARRRVLLVPSVIPCSLFPLISRIHFSLISDWRRIVSSKFFDTQISPISIEELVLPRHAHCVLSRLCCNEHSLLLSSYLSRISIIENPS